MLIFYTIFVKFFLLFSNFSLYSLFTTSKEPIPKRESVLLYRLTILYYENFILIFVLIFSFIFDNLNRMLQMLQRHLLYLRVNLEQF